MKRRKKAFAIWLLLIAVLLVGAVAVQPAASHGTVQSVLLDAVNHHTNRVSLFGLMKVNPGMISAFVITGCMLLFALVVRLFVIPRFKTVPHGFQLILEESVRLFDQQAKSASPHKNRTLGAFLFASGSYIFISTIFELVGIQVITTHGVSIPLPAPLADLNGALAMGCLAYLFILISAVKNNGAKGLAHALQDFLMPLSLSLPLFGALLCGLLMTELVYCFIRMSFVIPVIVAVMLTLVHALIQTYAFATITSLSYGECMHHEDGETHHEDN